MIGNVILEGKEYQFIPNKEIFELKKITIKEATERFIELFNEEEDARKTVAKDEDTVFVLSEVRKVIKNVMLEESDMEVCNKRIKKTITEERENLLVFKIDVGKKKIFLTN